MNFEELKLLIVIISVVLGIILIASKIYFDKKNNKPFDYYDLLIIGAILLTIFGRYEFNNKNTNGLYSLAAGVLLLIILTRFKNRLTPPPNANPDTNIKQQKNQALFLLSFIVFSILFAVLILIFVK